ncbi:MAG TPA: hypothetical protein VFV49_05060 [Thermoanaerobaculia bacterium]|nr:hypothetical protein [Thermoanaerobaculia bacterium]
MEHQSLDRRDFLLIGSAAAVGIATVGVSASPLNAITRTDGADPILSVGFAATNASQAVAADSLLFGDASLAHSVRVTVHGLWRAESQAAPTAVHVSAFYPNGNDRNPFMAWSSNASSAPRVSFTMNFAGRESLALGIERERLVSSRFRRSRLGRVLAPSQDVPDASVIERNGGLATFGSEGMKLHRGTYFFALRGAKSDRIPNWASLSVDAEQLRAGGDSVLRSSSGKVGFDYVAVSVEPV